MKRLLIANLCITLSLFADPAIDQALSELTSYTENQKHLTVQNPDLWDEKSSFNGRSFV